MGGLTSCGGDLCGKGFEVEDVVEVDSCIGDGNILEEDGVLVRARNSVKSSC